MTFASASTFLIRSKRQSHSIPWAGLWLGSKRHNLFLPWSLRHANSSLCRLVSAVGIEVVVVVPVQYERPNASTLLETTPITGYLLEHLRFRLPRFGARRTGSPDPSLSPKTINLAFALVVLSSSIR